MGKTLKHKSGRTVTVPAKQAEFYTANGWEEVSDGRSTESGKSSSRKAAKAE